MATEVIVKPYISADTAQLADSLIVSIEAAIAAGNEVTKQDLIGWLIDYVEAHSSTILELSTVRPDFESIKQQFFAKLSQKSTWKDIIQAGGGETVLEFIAAIGALGQDGVAVALQENYYDTAALTSSVLIITRTLGVHIARKIPAHVDILLTNSSGGDMAVPRLSQFMVNGQPYFNRNSIVFDRATGKVAVRLYQGSLNVYTVLSTGGPYQRFEVGENKYDIANEDIYCFTPTNDEWVRATDGPWNYKQTDKIFFENTTPEGSVEILVGNNIYGATPPSNQILSFMFATTNGILSNSTNIGLPVNLVTVNQLVPDRIKRPTTDETNTEIARMLGAISGATTTVISGGDNERDKDFYSAVGPFLFSGRKGMIRKKEHYAVALEFPGVIDVLFQNQKDISPYNRNLINVVYVTPLMTGGRAMTDAEWVDFTAFMDSRQIWRVDWVHYRPTGYEINVNAILYCLRNSDVTNIKSYAEYKLREAFTLGRNTLGRSLELTDITDQLKLSYYNMRVDFVELLDPTVGQRVLKTDYIKLGNITLDAKFSTRNYGSFVPNRTEDIEEF